MFEVFESKRSNRSPIILILEVRSSQLDKNLKMRPKTCGRKKWELFLLFFCRSDWAFVLKTCRKQMTVREISALNLKKTDALKPNWEVIQCKTCFGLAPPRRTSNSVAQRSSVCGNLKSLSDIMEKIGCICMHIFLLSSVRNLDRPTGM